MSEEKKKAVALKYDQAGGSAPKVVATGSGAIAEKIIQKAQEFDVPVFQNKALAESLLKLEVDEEIPPSLYKAVAEVFVWLMQSEEKAGMSR